MKTNPMLRQAEANYVIHGDNAEVLSRLPDSKFQLIYIDPPFNTGSTRQHTAGAYADTFDDFAQFIAPRLEEARRLLTESGTLYFHIDYREAHYCKILLDDIFGRDAFLNEVIWAYDYGGRGKDRWPAKHDTILVYVKTPKGHLFVQDQITRIPYMAPGLVTKEKAARGKLPTDVWWHTIVPTNGKEKTGYPTQKPEGVLRRVLEPSTRPGDWVLDFFAGSGTTGVVAAKMGRRFVMVDSNPEAITVMRNRLETSGIECLILGEE